MYVRYGYFIVFVCYVGMYLFMRMYVCMHECMLCM